MPKKRGRPKKLPPLNEHNIVSVVADLQTKYKEANAYLASIKVLGVLYLATGSSKDEAIANLKVPKGLGTSVLTVSNGKLSQAKVFNTIQTARLFSISPKVREYALKNTCLRFDL